MYFRHFPKVAYRAGGMEEPRLATNLASYAHIDFNTLDDVSYYRFYDISDGDRPDNVSELLYGTPIYYWTFFVVNEHLNSLYDDWPKGSRHFDQWIAARYSNLAAVVDLRPDYLPDNRIEGKFRIGEQCTGQLSDGVGVVEAKFPTLGFVEIRRTAGAFQESGESIVGSDTQDSVAADRIVPLYEAPHHYVDADGEATTREDGEENELGHRPAVRAVSILEHERERELRNSRIRVVKKERIESVAAAFRREMARR